MNKENAIEVRNMTKYFKVEYDKAHTLKERLLSFGKSNREVHTVLKNINLDIKKGETVCLIGTNGSGKSTLLKLLMRIYQGEGDILFNNESIEKINSQTLKENMSYVDQETFLFKDTLYHNITLLNPAYSQEDVIEACKQAQIHDFIMSLPQGYQTVYDENISGGQKQRIGLARAFLRKTPILLLDEPTSRIDSLNEAALLESLKQIKDEKLIIIVSHRKSSLALCDEIIEIEQGIIKH